MSLKMKKELALFLAAAMILLGMPIYAHAAAAPAFQATYSAFYENRANQGIYDIQVKNVQKGYILKWHITGKGKKYASFDTKKIIAQGTTATNKLTIDSNGEMAYATGERIRITVNVYTAKWKLVDKITFAGKLQCKAKAINIDTSAVSDLNQLKSGETYAFRAVMTPANATSKVYWQVKDAKGTDCSLQITEDGRWTPQQPGEYTVTAMAKNSANGQALCTKQVQATVGTFIEKIEQTASNGFRITFGTAPAVQFKEADFSITSGETAVVAKKVKYSQDGKTADVATATSFVDARTYKVSCAGYSSEFTASVGKPIRIQITTASAQAGKYTTIDYALYDAKGIDITETVKNGTFRYTANVTNGLLDQQTNQLFMTTVGSIANVTLEYTAIDGTRMEDTKTIVCVEQKAEEAVESRFTLTKSAQVPAFKEADVREIAIGDTMYAHFMALNENGNTIAYDSVLYASSDPDSLIVSAEGRLTPIKAGAVTVMVTATQNGIPITYTYNVTVKAGRYLSSIQMETAINVSNVSVSGYQKEIPVTALDQYGESMVLVNATGTVTEAYGNTSIAEYDAANSVVRILPKSKKAGIYNCVLSLTVNGITLNQNFTIIVQEPKVNDPTTYQVELSSSAVDLAVNESTDANKEIQVRLAEYRGGVFYNYADFQSVEVRKGNVSYAADMKTPGTVVVTGSSVILSPLMISPVPGNSVYMCSKAEAGIYTVTLKYRQIQSYTGGYVERSATANLELKDTQSLPEYSIKSQMTSATVAKAQQVAADCIQLAGSDMIVNCTVTGNANPGYAVDVKSGEQIHISTITVRTIITIKNNRQVYVDYVIPVGKTFTNR